MNPQINNRKIILRLLGGLGNQLFIYAFGKAIEINYGFDVRYDTFSGFIGDDYKRKYELDNFNINLKKVSLYESLFYPINKRSKIIQKLFYPGSILIEEDENIFVETIKKVSEKYMRIYFKGYFQKLEYFENVKEELKKEIVLMKPLSESAKTYLKAITNSNSVAVHLRLKERAVRSQLRFYEENIERFKKELKNPIFFVFSDDIKYCKDNMKLDLPFNFIENTNDPLEDFWLMKNCKHFIISDSTFSWWSAWLSGSKSKRICTPDKKY